MIVWVKVGFRKTVTGDRSFYYLSGSNVQSQMKSLCQMMVFMPLVVVLIGQFSRDVIGHQGNSLFIEVKLVSG